MATYVITGVSRGIGYEFMRQISSDPNNNVIGIVRDRPTTINKIAHDQDLSGRSNIRILEADITKYDAIKRVAGEAAKITGGSIDYLIANAGYVSLFDAYEPIGKLDEKPKELEEDLNKLMNINVIANIHLYTLFMPLILKGKTKKVICISSGLADLDLANELDLELGSLYAVSKAAMNMINAKFSAQYKKDGVLVLSICPGMVDVGHYNNSTPEQMSVLGDSMMKKFVQYEPSFQGPATPEVACRDVRSVWEKASIKNGNGGGFLSHLGNKRWL